jgi:hypothetical protein
MQKLLVKITLAGFFYAKGIIHHKRGPEKQTVNANFYEAVIKILVVLVHRVRHEFQESYLGIVCTTV